VITSSRTYEIHEVAELTGLATARLRAWERRYEVIRPKRLPNRYRVYTSEQVALLRAYGRLVGAGERIGLLVRQPHDAVLARAEGKATDGSPLAVLVDAIRRFDHGRLTALLSDHRSRMDIEQFTREIVLPLGEVVGDLWVLGQINISAEHLASEVVVHLLKRDIEERAPSSGPVLLAACLPGERHEWGMLSTLALLQTRGWRVRYLGADLPLQEVVDAAWTVVPVAVALSSADPANVASRLAELRRLPRLLPPGTLVVLGGQGAEANSSRLRRAGLRVGQQALPEPRAVPEARLKPEPRMAGRAR
jgi:hypothetical protein